MADLSKRLLNLKNDLEEDEKEFKEAQAEYKVLMSQLKSEYNLSSVEEAKKEIKALTNKEQILMEKIEQTIEDIEEHYEV